MPDSEQPASAAAESYLFDRYFDTDLYTSRSISGPAIVRLPYALFGPTIVTHFPFFQSSHEQQRPKGSTRGQTDEFEECSGRFDKLLKKKKDSYFPETCLTQFIDGKAAKDKRDRAEIETAVVHLWNRCIEEIQNTRRENIVFDARTLIFLDINRKAHNAIVVAIANVDPAGTATRSDAAEPADASTSLSAAWAPFRNDPLRKEVFNYVNDVLAIFFGQLNLLLSEFQNNESEHRRDHDGFRSRIKRAWARLRAVFGAGPALGGDTHYPPVELGGFISWFHARDILPFKDSRKPLDAESEVPAQQDEIHEDLDYPRSFNRTDSDGRALYALEPPIFPAKHEPVTDKYFIWRRGDKNWRYTFCEGNFRYHAELECIPWTDDAASRSDGKKDARNKVAAEHRAKCRADLADFFRRLLSSRRLKDSFPKLAIENQQEFEFRKLYPFPGRRGSGSQYFVIPAELLIILASMPKEIARQVCATKGCIYDFDLHSLMRRDFESCIKLLCKLDEDVRIKNAVREFESKAQFEKIPPELRPAASDANPPEDDSFQSVWEDIQARLTTAAAGADDAFIEEVLASAETLRTKLRGLFKEIVGVRLQSENALTEDQNTFYRIFVELAELLWKRVYGGPRHRAGHDDFVTSIVIDGSAVYFSNFRPHGDDAFTRTFFIDFNLAPYQRGRLVRRLCEIATYRMSCVKDLHLFYALQDGINQLNKYFTRIIAVASHGNWTETLRLAVKLYFSAARFDMYVPEGISACRRAVAGDWQRVKQQVADIRERRLTGYAQLSDFLERGLAVSVMEITRIADRYEHLMNRTNELMLTIRTEMSGQESGLQTRLVKVGIIIAILTLFNKSAVQEPRQVRPRSRSSRRDRNCRDCRSLEHLAAPAQIAASETGGCRSPPTARPPRRHGQPPQWRHRASPPVSRPPR